MPSTFPDFRGNACAAFDKDEREKLKTAALLLADGANLVVRLAAILGTTTEWASSKAMDFAEKAFGIGWRDKVQAATEDALWRAHDLATTGLDPKGDRDPWDWFNKGVVTASGAVTGFFGLPGAVVDVPLTTMMIMRSVAEIARSHGEDLADDDAKRACIQVFAFGGPDPEDDEAEIGYWTVRAGLSHATVDLLIKQVVQRFSINVSEKVAAGAVPLIGAGAGAVLNYAFMDFYQDMARVHFTLRALERRHGSESSVRACFDGLVRQAKNRKRTNGASRPKHTGDTNDQQEQVE